MNRKILSLVLVFSLFFSAALAAKYRPLTNPHGRGQDLSHFLNSDPKKMIFIDTDENETEVYVEPPQNFKHYQNGGKSAWVYRFFHRDSPYLKAGNTLMTHIYFSCDGRYQIIGDKIYADHQLKKLKSQGSIPIDLNKLKRFDPDSWTFKEAYAVCHYQQNSAF